MVRYDAARKLYEMWYGAGTLTSGGDFIGYATSTDGVAWDRPLEQPVLGPGTPGSWDGSWVDIPRVHLDPGTGLYRMWFHGSKGSFIDQGLGYATAPRDDAPSRRVERPPGGCRVAVTIERRLREGEDPDVPLEGKETVFGPFTKEAVTASGASRVEDLPRTPSAPVNDRFFVYVVGPLPGCENGNGSAKSNGGNGSYALESIGQDIGPGGDSFTFAFTRVKGDFTLTAHLQTPGPRPGKSGLMVRPDLSRRSRYSRSEEHTSELQSRL